MANTLWVTEYEHLQEDSRGNILPIPREPAIRTQSIDFTSGSANIALDGKTTYVRLRADTICFVKFSSASTPTATTSDEPIEANIPETRAVYPGARYIAAVGAS